MKKRKEIKVNLSDMGFGLDYFQTQLSGLVGWYNQEKSPGGTMETVCMAIQTPKSRDFVYSVSEAGGYDRNKIRLDWFLAQSTATFLSMHPNSESVMEGPDQLRNLEAVRYGARAIRVGRLILGLHGATDPDLNEALGLSIFSGLGLVQLPDVVRISRFSGSDPRAILPFHWTEGRVVSV